MIKPGSLVSFVTPDGNMRTDIYQAPMPVVYPQLSPLRRMVRRLTPRRWRKPLRPVLPPSPVERCLRMHQDINRHLKQLVR